MSRDGQLSRCPNPYAWDSGTPALHAGHLLGQHAGQQGRASLKTLAAQVLARAEARDSKRDTGRDSSPQSCPGPRDGVGQFSPPVPAAPPGAPADAWQLQWRTAQRILKAHAGALEAAGWSRAELLAVGVTWHRFDQRGPLMLIQPGATLEEIAPDRLAWRTRTGGRLVFRRGERAAT